MPIQTLEDWATHLRRLADPVIENSPPSHRPVSSGVQMATLLEMAIRGEVVNDPIPAPAGRMLPADELFWRAVVSHAHRPEVAVRLGERLDADTGPLFVQSAFRTIECWTEAELAGLHALEVLAYQLNDDAYRAIVGSAAMWHLEHTQPDNATGRPWALHVFLLLDTPESRHYAETLLHNALAMTGSPEPLSARILRHAAEQLVRRGVANAAD